MFAFKSTALVAALVVSAFAIPAPDAGAKPFTLKNGQDALALNNKFASLSANSKCTDGEDACIDKDFAQCSNGKFVLMPCGAGTICVALPLVNKPGTSVTCSTEADKNARIAATGATGGGDSGDADPSSAAADPAPSPAAPKAAKKNNASPASASPAPANGAKPFTLSNGKDAQALNAKFATLTDNSACTTGENACIGDEFAQCVNGKFVKTACGGGLKCAALPLVNSKGTSITCVDEPQALQRIKDTGAGDSLTGN